MDGAFGAILDGVDFDFSREGEFTSLVDALYEHHILLLRDQYLEPASYIRFGRMWGQPILFFNPGHRDSEFPEIIRIHNSPSTPQATRDAAMHWHVDGSYEAIPASMTMLYGIEAPAAGNETVFSDMAAAYDALSPSTRGELESLWVEHRVGGGTVLLEGEKRGEGGNAAANALPPVVQPLVIRHPVTGRKALYGISGSAAGIVGMTEESAVSLLLDLKKHAIQRQFLASARAVRGCVVMWDNFGVMHSATRTEYTDEEGKRRLLHRISTRGLPSVTGISLDWPTTVLPG